MATTTLTTNGHAKGQPNGIKSAPTPKRFSTIPNSIDIPVSELDGDAVELDLVELSDDVTELCTLLDNENAKGSLWLTVALAYAKQHSLDLSIEIINRGLQSVTRVGKPKDKIGLLTLLCWLFLWKSREAPRIPRGGELVSEAKTKEFYLHATIGAINDASKVQPQFPPLLLAKGVHQLLRASLQSPVSATGNAAQSERGESLRQALRNFDDVYKASGGRNMMALLGKARTFFAMKRYEDSYKAYQDVLARMPELHEPDPRIGIGCCLWQLNHPEEAKQAWQRAIDVSSGSSMATTLLGIAAVRDARTASIQTRDFYANYQKAAHDLVQKTLDSEQLVPLAYVNLAGLFMQQQNFSAADALARKTLELTDTNPVSSDAWFYLAQKEHSSEIADWARVEEFYTRSDGQRPGEKGFLSAKFGVIQAQVAANKKTDARFRLDKLSQQNASSLEVKAILGTLYAEEVFTNETGTVKDDKSAEHKKAVAFLESVRTAGKDKKIEPDLNVLMTLSKLYGTDSPEKALQCLEEAKKYLLDNLTVDAKHPEIEDSKEQLKQQLTYLPPQFLNNIGCHQFQLEKWAEAVTSFQAALSACADEAGDDDTDSLITTITYNLARAYEGEKMHENAAKTYNELLSRHSDYTDAQARLAYLRFEHKDNQEGHEAIEQLFNQNPSDLDIRALYGWSLNHTKKFSLDLGQDPEQKHHKQTLQHFDKHDIYALTAMGNINLKAAREMPRDTDSRRERRRKQYETAIAFFKRVLDLDPQNVFAAQGIAIALIEDQKNLDDALPILLKCKENIRSSNSLVNLGHAFVEKKDYERATEHFEAAIKDGRGDDPVVLSAYARVHLYKGQKDKSLTDLQTALEYARKALDLGPDDVYYKFNVAFMQFQISTFLGRIPKEQLTVSDVETAIADLEQAIVSFSEMSKVKAPPYPRADLEQRASMGKSTMKRQLDRILQTQKEYESENAEKAEKMRKQREEKKRKAEEEELKAQEIERAEKARQLESRLKLQAEAQAMAEKRMQAEKEREEAEYTEDSDGNRIKRTKTRGKRKKKDTVVSDNDASDAAPKRKSKRASPDDGDDVPKKKKRKLARKETKANPKHISAATIEDSDEELAALDTTRITRDDSDDEDAGPQQTQIADVSMADVDDLDDDEEEIVKPASRKKQARVVEDDDEDDEDAAERYAEPPNKAVADDAGAAGNPDAGVVQDGHGDEVNEGWGDRTN